MKNYEKFKLGNIKLLSGKVFKSAELAYKTYGTLNKNGSNVIELEGRPLLVSKEVSVPSDPSSASFPIVAALITPNSKIEIHNVMINHII